METVEAWAESVECLVREPADCLQRTVVGDRAHRQPVLKMCIWPLTTSRISTVLAAALARLGKAVQTRNPQSFIGLHAMQRNTPQR